MNKGITLLILGVVLCAMGVVFYTNMAGDPSKLASPQETAGASFQNATAALTSPHLAEASSPAAVTVSSDGNKVQELQDMAVPKQTVQEEARKIVTQTPIVSPTEAVSSSVKSVEPVAQPAPVAVEASMKGEKRYKAPEAVQEKKEEPAASSKLDVQKLSLTAEHELRSIGVHFAGQQMKIRIEANNPFPCKMFILPSPDRLVIDLPGKWKGVSAPKVPENKIIKGARVGKQDAGPRIVLDLTAVPKGHKLERLSDNVVEIFIH